MRQAWVVSGRWIAVTLLAIVSLVACGGGSNEPASEAGREPATNDGTWTIGARTLPPPAGASDELRESIASTPQPDPSRIERIPATDEEWIRIVEARRAQSARNVDALAQRWSVAIVEDEVGGVTVYRVTPERMDPSGAKRLFVHVHGGAYVFGGGPGAAFEAAVIAYHAGIPALSIDYRMPPEDPFPAAVDDVAAVWQALLTERPAGSMALGGTSAGGGLALASTLRFIELGLETPGALWAGTPWADLTKTGDSRFTNEGIDRVLVGYDGVLEAAAKLYAGGRDLRTPLISPVYGDFAGFPPTYLVTGTRDLFLSDVVRVHRKMRAAGVIADLNVYEGHSHVDYFMESPEMEQVFGELAAFLRQHLR